MVFSYKVRESILHVQWYPELPQPDLWHLQLFTRYSKPTSQVWKRVVRSNGQLTRTVCKINLKPIPIQNIRHHVSPLLSWHHVWPIFEETALFIITDREGNLANPDLGHFFLFPKLFGKSGFPCVMTVIFDL